MFRRFGFRVQAYMGFYVERQILRVGLDVREYFLDSTPSTSAFPPAPLFSRTIAILWRL